MTLPDASLHNPAPAYLRGLLAQAGLSQRQAAARIGISDRQMRYYLVPAETGARSMPAPYAIQYALERLADEAWER